MNFILVTRLNVCHRCIMILLGLMFAQLSVLAQNLVQNGNFEEYLVCPVNFTAWQANYDFIPSWSYPTKGTPDYFNTCSKYEAGVPKNFAGYANPNSGRGYVGIVLLGTQPDYREYIQTELAATLVPGKKYCVSFSYMLAAKSKYTINQLGLVFSSGKIKKEIQTNIGLKPHVSFNTFNYLRSDFQWDTICAVYTATGEERFLVIGNFEISANTRAKDVLNEHPNFVGKKKEYCYVYIDDVVVRPINECKLCPCFISDLQSEVVESGNRVAVEISGGVEPYIVSWNIGGNSRKVNKTKTGYYVATITDATGCSIKDSVLISNITPIVNESIEEKLNRIEEGNTLVLENIFFEFNRSNLLPDSYKELDILINFMISTDVKKVEISGHSDNVGSADYNLKLSEERAKTVVEYLIYKGIAADKLIFKGYGSKFPIADNATEDGRNKNRRVEFKLIQK